MVDLSKYKSLFLSESGEHLQSMNDCLLKLEQGSFDDDTIAQAFRNAHSIKGMAASMGYVEIRDLAHSMEDLLDQVRLKQRVVEKEMVEVLFKAVDRIESMLKEIEQDKALSPGWQETQNTIRELLKKKPDPAPAKAPAPAGEVRPQKEKEQTPGQGVEIKVLISPEADAPSVRGLILYKRLEEIGKMIRAVPDKDSIKQGKIEKTPEGYPICFLLEPSADQAAIKSALEKVSELKKFEVQLVQAVEPAPAAKPAELKARPEAAAAPLPQTVRVKTELLDDFINILGEMILIKGELEDTWRKAPQPALRQRLDRLDRLTREFHDQVMAARLMPVETVLQRFPRLVRDLAREQGKEVELEIIGKEIELDRALIEKLPDPLVHIIRNAIDHGIEPPAERRKAGKKPAGQVVIEASRERDMILLSIRDDGRGIDPEVVRKKAVEKGLLDPAKAAEQTCEQIMNLVFVPGFSTAARVGMTSGRGVGMDVVKTVIEGMSGMVSLASEPGKGTTITLHLPQTVAIVKVLLIRLLQEIFAIPVNRILRSVEILPYQLRKSQSQEYYVERQELIPLSYLHKLLDLKTPEQHAFPLNALILEVKRKKMALAVDDLVGQEDAFIRPLGRPLERIPGLSGVTMLGDGKIVFVLDLIGLF